MISKTLFQEQGFTMVEVLVAVVIATAFVALAMQAMVLATILRVKAQEKAKGNQWIQEDIETVKSLVTAPPLDKSLCLATSYSAGYANNLKNRLPSPDLPIEQAFLNFGYNWRLTREYVENDFNILKIKYKVETLNGSAKTIARDYIEVIPNAALQCP